MSGQVVVHADKQVLADASAARLITAIADAQAVRGEAHIVLTGGSMGGAILESLVASPARKAISWELVHVWWGDERFLPGGDPERNETQARAAGLDRLLAEGLDEATIHPMGATDGPDGDDVQAAARRYAEELVGAADEDTQVLADLGIPIFDVVMLGVGPDAHVASLFPGHDSLDVDDAATLAETDSPKPPPVRISLTRPAINGARAVWFLVAGADKADAVAASLGSEDRHQAPAGGVQGTESTLWLVDEEAATKLP